ncbi:MAG: MBL fold metallo-hydrolase [Mixta calida]|uniref:MBL fold metallo-hydrolase n=1 Tax=Mixta calida TaxID=665913 RepID=UPI002908F978|nr:MBL fold metallo-hydrolase [Mixta calida]MDU4942379.1 MBL fold metallo-hydrolase [Mixta calida]
MKLTQIRNATLLLNYAGVKFLIDPMLADKEAWEGFPGTARSHLRNPLVALPLPLETLLDVDAIIVTHTHRDHWDEAAAAHISKDMLIFTQNAADAELIRAQGFTRIQVLEERNTFAGITLIKTDGQHGSDEAYSNPEIAALLGDACGLVFQHPDEKTLYIAGDTIWVKPYIDSLNAWRPDVVVVNAGFAQVDHIGAIIMGKEDILRTHQALPQATIVASHMEAVNHCILSRDELREYASEQGLQACLRIPADGESCYF